MYIFISKTHFLYFFYNIKNSTFCFIFNKLNWSNEKIMKKLEELLTFLYERREDERVIFQKEKKPDGRNYYVYFEPDDDPSNVNKYTYKGRLMVYIDQENKCITISYGSSDEVVIEDDDLIKKWSDKIEEYIQEINETNFTIMIEEAFNDAYRKDFHRDWKLKKIFDKEDESI